MKFGLGINVQARREGRWLEAIAAGYSVLDAHLRWVIWLNTQLTNEEHTEIEGKRNLLAVAQMALDRKLLTETEYESIEEFNEGRRLATHYLLDTDWNYPDLKPVSDLFVPIHGMLQNKWLGISPGEPESP